MVLACVPLAAWFGRLQIWHLYVVGFVVSILTVLFAVAYPAYLPELIGEDRLVEGNGKLAASAAVAEFSGFSAGGWLVQVLTAPLAILVDAASFAVSAVTLGLIRDREPEVHSARTSPNVFGEIREGIAAVHSSPLLSASALATMVFGVTRGVLGALMVLYVSRDLGLNPGILGMIWAVGGVSSFAGALWAERVTGRLGSGQAMILGLATFGLSLFCVPLATGATSIAVLLLILQQCGDGFLVLYEINQTSLAQTVTSGRLLGRVTATLHVLGLGTALVGSVLGGWLAGMWGPRLVLASGAAMACVAALLLAFSPVRSYLPASRAGDPE